MEDKTFGLLTKMYSDITNRFDSIEKKLEEKSDKKDIVRLENKLDDNSKALFDGYKQSLENTFEIKSDIKEIKEALNIHELKLLKGLK